MIKNKLPEKKLVADTSSVLSLADGVYLNFIDYKDKKYLVNIAINLDLLYNHKDNDFGIFLYDGFPLNGAWYEDKSFSTLLEKLNNHITNKFSRQRSYTYSTMFEKLELKDPSFLENYFADKEKFRRTKKKVIKNMVIMSANHITLTNQLTYDGIDPQYRPMTPPGRN
ncbi:hypothetical protein LZQ00_15555 [Sphingobacterium sp. SRCM116780]|uniref:hypothetical protein n=1 Tax=Sphingobacterium sp. SRCM116780 TaxID=2907623 RepID=UPI001F40D296|nr:hypothetical protein [Sphingobacterium sp. SRCM116780]UIR55673.1 hypothetical protein LZQ00_15555 [Sphingobacterium sp. SRCM116780]